MFIPGFLSEMVNCSFLGVPAAQVSPAMIWDCRLISVCASGHLTECRL
uniref:Uncharacterized protein n=1 Tax=Anguilla anguilla TaxID=7936 RepID=A0A0E9UMG5_ANGAN